MTYVADHDHQVLSPGVVRLGFLPAVATLALGGTALRDRWHRYARVLCRP